MRARLRSLPLRVKLTLIFAAAMAAVLAGLGWWIHLRVRDDVDHSIRQALRARSGALVQSVKEQWPNRGELIEPDERFAQVLASDGTIIDSRPEHDAALLSPLEVRRALHRNGFVERPEQFRLLTRHLDLPGERVVAVVASSLAQRESAIEGVGTALAVSGTIALMLASGAAYLLAAGALRPVDRIRRRAEQIGAADPGARLPDTGHDDELGRLARTLNAMLARIAQATAAERAFIANASHELRTPLAALRSELELALGGDADETSLREAISASLADVDRLSRLAEDLLVLARLDEGRLPMRRQPVVVEELFSAVRRTLPPSDCPPRFGEGSGLVIDADPQRAAQALTNLIDNAQRHGTGPIEVTASRCAESVQIAVEDNGPPLPAEVRRHAFDRFASYGPDGRSSGLGLAIVDAIAKEHGGRARLENTPEGRVRATLELPGHE